MSTPAPRLIAALSDRYRIERELGAGGMATVYLAQDLKHDRLVAVKVLRPELAAVIGADRFLAEIKTTANLQHPHILPLFDSGVAGGEEHDEQEQGMPRPYLFYVMPFIEGESLRDRLAREKQLPIPDAIRIATEVASALDYAHRHGVIHRDIKPENILLHDGSALVADFGIALAAGKAGSRMTETGMSLGTPHYMSPEQAMGEREITARSDVYALGCILYEMLVGQPPFTGATAQAIVAKVVTEKPPALIPQRDTVPENVEDAVLTALNKLPADRFGSAAEFAAALTGAGTVSMPRHRRATTPRWRIPALLVATALVAGFAGTMFRSGPTATPTTTIRFTVTERLGDIDFGPGIDISRDGSHIVFIGRDSTGRTALFHRGMADGVTKLIPGTDNAIVRAPAFSPDGRMVAYTSESKLRTIALDGGSERTVVDNISPTSGGLSWGAGDVIVFQPGFGQGLSVASLKDSRVRPLTKVDTLKGEDHRWPQVLPDGKSVLFTLWTGNDASAQIAIASLTTGEIRVLMPGEYARYIDDGHIVFIGTNRVVSRIGFDPGSGKIRGTATSTSETVWVPGDGSAQFAVSGNGTFVYLESLGKRIPVMVDRTGAAADVSGVKGDVYMSPRFSPSGGAFAIEVAQGLADIWLYDVGAGTFSKITDGGGYYPVWTPTGDRIIYSRDERAEVNVYSVPVNRSEAIRSVIAHKGQQRTQDLSHDGKHLLLRQNMGGGQYDLYVMSVDSGNAITPWLATPSLERAPAFSPNDKWVAYSSNESGKEEVYVRPFAGTGGRIPVSSGGGIEPLWSRDGTELFFRSTDGSLQVVKVDAGTTFRVLTRPTTLFQGHLFWYAWSRQYDITRDGKHFLFLRNATAGMELHVVVGWMGADSTRR